MDIFEGNMAVEAVNAEDVQIPDTFSNKQRLAIELLGRGDLSHKQIAESVGCSINTLDRWRKNPAFVNEVKLYSDRRGTERREKMMDILDDSALEAVKVMAELLKSDKDNVRLNAAKLIFDTQSKMNAEKEGGIAVSFGCMPSPVMPVRDLSKGET